MSRLLLGLLLTFCASAQTESDWLALLERVRAGVIDQVSRSANYACVETVERSYWRSIHPVSAACSAKEALLPRKEVMYDRLRLDMAVSENSEIFSWHGENKFSSATISEIVQGGPTSSGSFVGYLRNIFMAKTVQFSLTGNATENGVRVATFHYVVPRGATVYQVKGTGGTATVPFHGSFSVNADTAEMISLRVAADDIPFGLDICAAESEIHYQFADISGSKTLIPSAFELQIDDDTHLFTESHAQYTQCHEFRAESTLRFDVAESAAAVAAANAPEQWLPAGLSLDLKLASPLDDRTAFMGDPVQAVLAAPVHLPGKRVIPAGATVHGIITQLLGFPDPDPKYFMRIRFDRITAGSTVYQMRAIHKPNIMEIDRFNALYGGVPPASASAELRNGTILIHTKHFHLDSHNFRADWKTQAPPATTPLSERKP